ncbi:MAG: Gfo/Idh/MocA family oxidoreductase [Victivallales bacterium]|jgi:predicted dehydrogenase|nr:Gfo/Idh/MocA family oxidoreductase [Victivallales bacterium]
MKTYKVAIVKDTSKKMLGLHGLQTAFRGLPNVEICAFVDPNSEDIAERMAFVGAKKHYTSMRVMFEAEKPDIVILTSRHPEDHLEQIRMASEFNCHIYCEKSLVDDLEEGDEILRILAKSKVKLCMAHPVRYAEPYMAMNRMIKEGVIGTPVSFIARGKCDHRGGGEDMIVLGTHILDWLIHLFGQAENVYADITVNGKSANKADLTSSVEPIGPCIGDSIYAIFRFSGGICGSFETHRGLYDVKVGNSQMGLTVMGTKGSLSLRFEDFHERKLFICRTAVPPESGGNFEEVPVTDTRNIPGAAPIDYSVCNFKDCPRVPNFPEANRYAVWDLMQAIEEDRPCVSNAHNAVQTQEMIQAIYLSHLTGKRVELPLKERRHPLK